MPRTLDSKDLKMTPIHPGSHTGHVTCLVPATMRVDWGLIVVILVAEYGLHPLVSIFREQTAGRND
jgi:hypothetical protein